MPIRSQTAGSAAAADRAEIVDRNFTAFVQGCPAIAPPDGTASVPDPDAPVRPGSGLGRRAFLELLESQMLSRHLDLMARRLRGADKVFYTIGSAGHEGNAVLGRLTRHTDPAFLHYRSGALMMERARQVPGIDPVRDAALALAASREDPIAGGRHKVWGSRPLWVVPQTSTVASHLPKAVGAAFAIEAAASSGRSPDVPAGSIVICSLGDASLNHSTAQGAINAAAWTAHRHMRLPLLLVCEDNGWGISVPTPEGWVEASMRGRRGIRYLKADGLDLAAAHDAARDAVAYCREQRAPVFLHLAVTRLMGHAGTDVETAYRDPAELEAAEAGDPLLRSAETALAAGLLSPEALLERYEAARARALEAGEWASRRPRLVTLAEVTAPLAPWRPGAVQREAARADYARRRSAAFGEGLPEDQPPRPLGPSINRALADLMAKYREALVFGEDVAHKGGVYGITRALARTFGPGRVFDTLLDEQAILGLAQGLGLMGFLPVPEIQYLAFFHNACDQIRGEACSLQFLAQGQFRNPMLLRIPGLGYQKGFGGHFHNDNGLAGLRDIPGLVVACPSRGDDAAAMLRTCAGLARVDGRVVVFLEPIALYGRRDLHRAGDGAWCFAYPPPDRAVPLGEGRVYGDEARDLLIVTFGNGVPMAVRAARRLRAEAGAETRVLDLRWLLPLNEAAIAGHAVECGKVLVLDEGRRSGGVGEGVVAAIVESGCAGISIRRVAGADSYTPLGPAAAAVLPDEDQVVAAARALLRGGASGKA